MAADPGVHVGVAGMIFDKQGRLAMLQRGPEATHGAGKWAVPGGWVDFGEQPLDAVVREAEEEVGLTCREPIFTAYVTNTYPDQGLHVVCLFFHLLVAHGVLHNMEPDKHSEVMWVPKVGVRAMQHEGLLFEPLADYLNLESTYPEMRRNPNARY